MSQKVAFTHSRRCFQVFVEVGKQNGLSNLTTVDLYQRRNAFGKTHCRFELLPNNSKIVKFLTYLGNSM